MHHSKTTQTFEEAKDHRICIDPWFSPPISPSVFSVHLTCLWKKRKVWNRVRSIQKLKNPRRSFKTILKKLIQFLNILFFSHNLIHLLLELETESLNWLRYIKAGIVVMLISHMYCLCSTWNRSLLSMVCSSKVRFCNIRVWIWSSKWRFSSSKLPFSWLNNYREKKKWVSI